MATAYMDRIQIDRIVPFDRREQLGMDRVVKDIDLGKVVEGKEKFPLQDGDRIQIFSILDARLNTVRIEGAITRTGNYELKDSLFLKDLIDQADGLLGDAYLKTVHVYRIMPDFKEQLIKLDLEKVLSGNKEHNIQLKSLDRVQIFSYSEMVSKNSVTIRGHIKLPGAYPLLESMTIRDLVFRAGGFVDEEFFKRTYLDRADLTRYDENKIKQKLISFNLGTLIDDKNHESNLILKPDDIITIYPKTIFKTAYGVTISGSVRNPGTFVIKNEMTLKDLILEAGGFPHDVYRYRIEISRIDPKNTNLNIYSTVSELFIDREFFESTTKNNNKVFSENNPKIMPYDLVFVRPDPYFSMQKVVSITGMIMYPGSYPILNPYETIKDIMDRAGGIAPNAYLEASRFIRNGIEIRLPLKKVYSGKSLESNFVIRNGDEIIIEGYPRIFSIVGEVNSPGQYPYYPKNRVSDGLKLSGGLTPNADKENIYISFPNGESKKYHRLTGNPKIMDGSVISVGVKPEEEPLDRTEYAKELTSIFANLAQVISIVFLASKDW